MITSGAARLIVNDEQIILRCHRHCDIFETLKLLHCNYDKNSVEQGFIDWDGTTERFVSREKAYKIALQEGQISGPTDTPGQLFSEDLW